MRVVIIDGQGGGMGRALTERLRAASPEAEIVAVGTNVLATAAMLKAGASAGATGENAVRVNCRRADVIAGPIGIVLADALLGEITPEMAWPRRPRARCSCPCRSATSRWRGSRS